MPAKVERCVKRVVASGKSESSAWAICNASVSEDAEYKGETVKINEPFETPDGPRAFGVYVRNNKDSIVLVRFDEPTGQEMQTEDVSVPAYWASRLRKYEQDSMAFTDTLVYDSATKQLISVRDGYQEYHSSEMGIDGNKMLKVYRSPETIAAIADMLNGIPVTKGHIDQSGAVADEMRAGEIQDTEIFNLAQPETDSSLCLKHSVDIRDAELLDAVANGKKELSLGYSARIVAHDKYDFEQFDIIPHHLAVVDRGRCGAACSFMDNKEQESDNMSVKEQVLKLIQDAKGQYNMQAIAEMVMQLQETVKDIPLTELNKIAPKLEQILAAAKAGDTSTPSEPMAGEGEKDMPEEKMEDSAAFKDAVTAIKDEYIGKMKALPNILVKAQKVLDEKYDFADKTPCDIMKDAIAAYYGEDHGFEDAEIQTAFKAMKPEKAPDYSKFGDTQTVTTTTKLEALKGKKWGE